MRARRRARFPRRSGISNLVGALFFVLVVSLALSVLIVMFTASSGYIEGIHSTNVQAVQSANSIVSVSDLAFGGQLAKTAAPVSISLNPSNPQLPLLPISDMNFTNGMQGWSVSKSYPNLVDGATVTNALQSNGSAYIEETPLTNPETFLLTVTNAGLPGHYIDRVSLLVDTDFTTVSGGSCVAGTCVGWNAPIISGNNLTIAVPPSFGDGIQPGFSATWSWSADVPAVAGDYYHTVVMYWYSNAGPSFSYVDYGTATVSSMVVSPLPLPNPSAPTITLSPRTAGIVPGGLIAGYDPNALLTTVTSGPGSIYFDFQPSLGGQQLAAGQELSAGVVFGTNFVLSPTEAAQVCSSGCFMGASLATSLDQVESAPNSMLYYHLLLVNPAGTTFLINPGGTDPTILNRFGATGWRQGVSQAGQSALGTSMNTLQDATPGINWAPGQWVGDTLVYTSGPAEGQSLTITSNTADTITTVTPFSPPPNPNGGDNFLIEGKLLFAPPAGFWQAGTYRYDLVVNMTVPGGPPSQTSMHFDDIGLALGLSTVGGAGSAYGSQVATLQLPATAQGPLGSYDQVQELTLGLNMSLSSTPPQSLGTTTAYVYVAEVPIPADPLSVTWVQVGSVNFNGSAAANVVVSAPDAAAYVNEAGQIQVEVDSIQVGGGASCPSLGPPLCTLSVSMYAIGQWENSPQAVGYAVVAVTEAQGAGPLQLSSLYITGDNGTVPAGALTGSTNGVARFTVTNWLSAGGTVLISVDLGSEHYSWVPGQVYQVTVVTQHGATYSESFTAP